MSESKKNINLGELEFKAKDFDFVQGDPVYVEGPANREAAARIANRILAGKLEKSPDVWIDADSDIWLDANLTEKLESGGKLHCRLVCIEKVEP